MLSLVRNEPALSDARAALASIQRKIGKVEADCTDIAAITNVALNAERKRKEADAALAAVGDLEQVQWHQYVESGALGRPPEPMVELRAERAADLAQTTARAEIARRRAADTEPTVAAAQARLIELAKERDRVAADVLIEEKDRIAAIYTANVCAAMQCELQIVALASEAIRLGQPGAAAAIRASLRLGDRQHWGQKLLRPDEPNNIRAQIKRFVERIRGDANADLDLGD